MHALTYATFLVSCKQKYKAIKVCGLVPKLYIPLHSR